jgi:hypothetical protein
MDEATQANDRASEHRAATEKAAPTPVVKADPGLVMDVIIGSGAPTADPDHS